MWQHEHFSRHKRSSKLMANFREILSECNLFDLGFHGLPWTYDNKQEGNRNVKVRLDRAVACPQWSAMYPHCKVSHIISSRSDHYPLYIQLLGNRPNVSVNKHLRYESYWERESKALDDHIRNCWNKSTQVRDLQDVASNLDKLMTSLHSWSRVHIGYLPKKLDAARKRLNRLFKRSDKVAVLERKETLLEMDELLIKEEIMWKQRSCLDKMKWGDRNTKFFRSKATWRAKKNNISSLRRNDGTVTENVVEIHNITNSFLSVYTHLMVQLILL